MTYFVIIFFSLQPIGSSKSLLITPDSLLFHATFVDSTVSLTSLTIQFSAGTAGEELFRVPIAKPGELHPNAVIRITVGMNPPAADNDPAVGISDGIARNQFFLVEQASSSTSSVNPCDVSNGIQNGRSAPAGDPVAGGYTLIFEPFHRFGSCTSNNGFATDGKFNSQIDLTKELNLVVNRDNSAENYVFHYFLVEFL